MKNKLFAFFTLALLSIVNAQLSTFAQGTAFTYQGRLNDAASPANWSYDLTFPRFKTPISNIQPPEKLQAPNLKGYL